MDGMRWKGSRWNQEAACTNHRWEIDSNVIHSDIQQLEIKVVLWRLLGKRLETVAFVQLF